MGPRLRGCCFSTLSGNTRTVSSSDQGVGGSEKPVGAPSASRRIIEVGVGFLYLIAAH